jgi:hypothetical protein
MARCALLCVEWLKGGGCWSCEVCIQPFHLCWEGSQLGPPVDLKGSHRYAALDGTRSDSGEQIQWQGARAWLLFRPWLATCNMLSGHTIVLLGP